MAIGVFLVIETIPEDKMVKELLEEIKKAEEKAESNLENARYKAKYMLDKEKENCENRKAEARTSQSKKRSEALEKVMLEGDNYKHEKYDVIVAKKNELLSMAKSKEAEVIGDVIEEIIN